MPSNSSNLISEANKYLLFQEAQDYIDSPSIAVDTQSRILEGILKKQVEMKITIFKLTERIEELERQNSQEKR